jgi:UDP-N-acetylglucosamine 2-epimerase
MSNIVTICYNLDEIKKFVEENPKTKIIIKFNNNKNANEEVMECLKYLDNIEGMDFLSLENYNSLTEECLRHLHSVNTVTFRKNCQYDCVKKF